MARLARTCLVAFAWSASAPAFAGPYTEPGHTPSEMVAWATDVAAFDRGPLDIAQPALGDASQGTPETALGPVAGTDPFDVVSLGDGGTITLHFDSGIGDGPGDDLAVFENGFYGPDGLFAELAFVEVSSNGTDFARFRAITLQQDPVPAFGTLDPSDLRYLAGDQPIGLGTGFDLAELANDPLVTQGRVDLQHIAYVRVVDVIGNGSTFDSQNAPVYDPYPTPFPQGGFDLQGVGVIHAMPEPGSTALLGAGIATLAALPRARRARTA
jgi:hypothetical protein